MNQIKKIFIISFLLIIMLLQLVFPLKIFASIDWNGSKWAREIKIHPKIMGTLTFPTDDPERGEVNFDLGKAANEASDFWKSKSAEDEDFKEWVKMFCSLIEISNPKKKAIISSGKAYMNINADFYEQLDNNGLGVTDNEAKIYVEQAKLAMTALTTNVSNCTDVDAYEGGEKVKDRMRMYKKIMEERYGSLGKTQTIAQSARASWAAFTVFSGFANDAYRI